MEIIAQKRDVLGKKVEALRKEGFVPAELYGQGQENVHLSVPAKDFSALYKTAGESTLIDVVVDGKKFPSLIQEVEIDSISQKIAHIDFRVVSLTEKISAGVVLEFINESPAVKAGGVLVKSMKEIEVEALPADLPQSFKVDLSMLINLHDSIYVKDLQVEEKVEILVEPETVIATVIEPAKEEEVAPAVNVEDVKVEGEEKKKEQEQEQKEVKE